MEISTQDIKIIQGCINGRPDAWEKFVERFSGLVMWSVKSRLSKVGAYFSEEDLEDIHQEIFLSLYNTNKLKQLKNPSKIAAWLYIISGNIALNHIRCKKDRLMQKSVSLFEEIAAGEGSTLTIADILESKDLPLAEQIDKKIKQEILEKLVESLNPKEKIIFNLHFIHENTIEEIADNLSLAQGTVASIIRRLKEKLKFDA